MAPQAPGCDAGASGFGAPRREHLGSRREQPVAHHHADVQWSAAGLGDESPFALGDAAPGRVAGGQGGVFDSGVNGHASHRKHGATLRSTA